MNHLLRALLLVVLAVPIGCGQFEGLTTFTMYYKTSTTIQKTFGVNLPFNLNTPPVTTNSEAQFRTENTRADLVQTITMKHLDFEITSPQGEDFSFLKEIFIYISADGLPEIEVGRKSPVPDQTTSVLELDVTDQNLQEYLKAEVFDLRVQAVTDEVISQDHKIDINAEFDVYAKLL